MDGYFLQMERFLETPGEDPDSKQAEQVRKKFKLGAYPIKEFNGIVFAYMGPQKKFLSFLIMMRMKFPIL